MKTGTAILLLLLAAGCSKDSREATKQEEQTPGRKYAEVPVTALDPNKMIPVGACRIVGTVLSVDSSEFLSGGTGPCSIAPCIAMVRIDSILGTGSSFTHPLTVGSAARMRFAYTLAPSKEFFPKLDPPLPGLRAGSRFKALIQSSAESTMPSVDSYDVYRQ